MNAQVLNKRADYATSADSLHWNLQNTAVIEGHDPEILKMADELYLLFYCPTKYNMGHKPVCDIRVAVFEGNLNELVLAEPRAPADAGKTRH
ncbi:MAG: hypothetical protein ACYS3N_03775 [Planctomycetota bacterium]|jgi:hypothetical protein